LVRVDDAWALSRLSPAEARLYRAMDPRDRHHAVAVARAILAERPDASPELLRAALLHDVGKSAAGYNPLERILVHLYTPKVPLTPRRRGLMGAWQRHCHHHLLGAEMILAAGGDARVAEIVARHHHPQGDEEAALLQRIDARY
jgi:putative nucleotidyltransferase with HDIG domain